MIAKKSILQPETNFWKHQNLHSAVPHRDICPSVFAMKFSPHLNYTIAQLLTAIWIALQQNCFQHISLVTRILLMIHYKTRALLSQICLILPPGDLCLRGKTKIVSGFLKYLGHFRPTVRAQAGLDEWEPLNKNRIDMHKHSSSQLCQPRCMYSVYVQKMAASLDSPYICCTVNLCLPVYLLQYILWMGWCSSSWAGSASLQHEYPFWIGWVCVSWLAGIYKS